MRSLSVLCLMLGLLLGGAAIIWVDSAFSVDNEEDPTPIITKITQIK